MQNNRQRKADFALRCLIINRSGSLYCIGKILIHPAMKEAFYGTTEQPK